MLYKPKAPIAKRLARTATGLVIKTGRALLGLVLVIIILYVGFNLWDNARRNPTAYCKVFHQEQARLTNLGGSLYRSEVFNLSVDNPRELGQSYEKLAQIAPKEIQTKAEILRNDYRSIDNVKNFASKPKFSDFLGVQRDIRRWTQEQCDSASP